MQEKQRGKEINIGKIGEFTVKLGSVNVMEPRVLYVNIKGRIPRENAVNFGSRREEIRVAVKRRINEMIRKSGKLNENFLYDFSLNDENLESGKKKTLLIEFMLKQKGNDVSSVKKITEELSEDIKSIGKMLCEYEK